MLARLPLNHSLRFAALMGLLAGGGIGMSGCGPTSADGKKFAATDSDLQVCAAGATVEGVDVSSYQGSIDWGAVAGAGIGFGITKATEGVTYVDPTFAGNWAGMRSAGMVRGAYHFFHPSDDANAQARMVVSTVGALQADDLPIVLDFEVLDGVSEATAVADAVVFLQAVSASTGKKAILYMSTDFLSGSYPELAAFPLWVANYGPPCPGVPGDWSKWAFWQYGDDGSIRGIPSGTDIDEFNGSLSELRAFAQGSGNPGSGPPASPCSLGGKSYQSNACTETLQCDNGSWVSRSSDPNFCQPGFLAAGACLEDDGTVVAQNTCTATLQCDEGVWLARSSDPSSCLGSGTPGTPPPTTCSLAGKTYAQNTCTETLQCSGGSWVTRSSDASSCTSGVEASGACLEDSGTVVPQNTCTSTLQCDNGVWVDRSSDPSACLGSTPSTSCSLAGKSYAQNTCTETLQCDAGRWVARSSDPSSCTSGIEANGACLEDNGTAVAQNTCTSTLQCDDGVWVDRSSDPSACLGSSSTSCTLAGKSYSQNTCTETLQCDAGRWVSRSSDPSSCSSGIEAAGACLTDSGQVVAQNTCTSTLQCDDGVWVDRSSDPAACL